jgi:hypothetical protein
VTILPSSGEDHFSMITARDRELRGLVLGSRSPRNMRARAPEAVPNNSRYGAIN